jgi:hypothetical protein
MLANKARIFGAKNSACWFYRCSFKLFALSIVNIIALLVFVSQKVRSDGMSPSRRQQVYCLEGHFLLLDRPPDCYPPSSELLQNLMLWSIVAGLVVLSSLSPTDR